MSLIDNLPEVRGSYREKTNLAKVTWFQVGGDAEILYRPADPKDLAHFLKQKPHDVPVTILGVGSNIIVRDGGINGVTIRMGRNFANMNIENDRLVVGSGCLDVNVAKFALENAIGGLEFLIGVPGTIGGALAMNAGAYGKEIKDVLVSASAIDREGNMHNLSLDDMGFSYRSNSIPEDWIFTDAVLQGKKEGQDKISKIMAEISKKREETQPIRTRTGGSTFKNPEGKKAWRLIDESSCRGLQVGGAKMSEKHCNFLINTGDATASDLENLGEEVRKMVRQKTGIDLEWEIRIVGNKL